MDYMMAAKPIINAIDAGNDPVSESGCGITVDPDNPEAVAAAIKRISEKSSDERYRIGRNGNKYVRENNDYSVLAQRFIEML
jgi:glycosyltransferase involved in cell wall biosynthesis